MVKIDCTCEFILQCPVFLPFHTVHGVLRARIQKWFAIPFSSGPHSVLGINTHIHYIYKIHNQQRPTVYHMGLYSVFWDNLYEKRI